MSPYHATLKIDNVIDSSTSAQNKHTTLHAINVGSLKSSALSIDVAIAVVEMKLTSVNENSTNTEIACSTDCWTVCARPKASSSRSYLTPSAVFPKTR